MARSDGKPFSLSDTLENVAQGPVPVAAPGRKLATLVVVQGTDADLGAHSRVEGRVVIGRDPSAGLVLTEAGASKQHAAVELVEGLAGRVRYEVEDLGSTNGTAVNGTRLKSRRKLKNGDKISLSNTVVRFSIADEVDAAFQAQVEAMLSTDDLTGLLSPRRFDAALDEALRAARENGTKVALLVLDIDGLKSINDVHGHAMGAFTIGQVGRLLAQAVTGKGTASRFGGDEFVAFLPGADRAEAVKVAEALRAAVAAHPFERDKVVVKPTVSVGLAVFPERGTTAKALFDAGDRALYRAKAKGKDCVVG
ncbi:MAG: GGDEF domain-containing protein [Archangium sp.]|nr:GGDEF domain-containing protein [Archangium sp.]